MGRRIPAAEARVGGFYRARNGRVLQVIDPRKVDGRWAAPPAADAVPYRAKANPASRRPGGQVVLRGWVLRGYVLEECPKPRWWAKADRERAGRLRRGSRPASETPGRTSAGA